MEKTLERKYDEFYYGFLSPIQKQYYRKIHRELTNVNNKYLLGLSVEKNNVEMDLQEAIKAFRRDHVEMYQLTGKYRLFWSSRTAVVVELDHYRYSGEFLPEDRVTQIVKMASRYRTELMQMAAVYEYFEEKHFCRRNTCGMSCPECGGFRGDNDRRKVHAVYLGVKKNGY